MLARDAAPTPDRPVALLRQYSPAPPPTLARLRHDLISLYTNEPVGEAFSSARDALLEMQRRNDEHQATMASAEKDLP